jgi:hypothetical protein
MYKPTRFSGKRPKFFAIECKDPFSQYLENQQIACYFAVRNAYSRMMFRVSADFTKPWYFTMFGCCRPFSQFRSRLVV